MSPHETLFLEPTNDVRVREIHNNPLVHLQVLDFPGGFDFAEEDDLNVDTIFKACGALVLVIDAQDEPHTEAIEYVVKIAEAAFKVKPSICFEVVIHKVDGDSGVGDERKISEYIQRTIQESISDHLRVAKIDIPMTFYVTSIYDHSIFEAFSKIVQKQIPQLTFLENLLDVLTTRCNIDNAFLFDVLSKIYVATDSNPFDMQTYELCSDVVDVVIDVSCIYGVDEAKDGRNSAVSTPSNAVKPIGNETLAFDSLSSAVIRQNNGYVLYLREVSKYLALVCMMKEQSFAKEGLVEHNIKCFKQALDELFNVKKKSSAPRKK
eukprot:TRINITY_DN2118_c0_g1_i1.p1 TRINITY_DN2118_c0_g1~~TRINITY_DN2118_c0_g1_i1.p1  ORF type:complete len:321 (-),score=108.84 TRINITY_DN2118_c0_g1_i1:61-1023(-)